MKYGILADIHGNLEALSACLGYLRGRVQAYLILGDIVGYGPFPNECIETIQNIENSAEKTVIAGNHDLASIGLIEAGLFNINARDSLLWTKEKLTKENKEYISGLRPRVDLPVFTMAHGSPRNPIDEYLLHEIEAEENLSYFDTNLCFVGHTHIPFFYCSKSKIMKAGVPFEINRKEKTIINPGAVGQPRDKDARAAFAVYDDKDSTVTIIRLPYNITKTQEAMHKNKMPAGLIERLAIGI